MMFCTLTNTSAWSRESYTPWEPGHERPLQSWIEPALLEQIANHFALSDAQVRQVDRIAREHRASFAALVERGQQIRDEFTQRMRRLDKGTLARAEMDIEREKALAPIADEQEALDERFLENVRSILSESQIEQWSTFLQRFNRQRWLAARTRFIEQPIDLIALIEGVMEQNQLDLQESEIANLLLTYSSEMDQALVARAESAIQRARRWQRTLAERRMTDGEKVWIGPHPQGEDAFLRERREEIRPDRRIRDINRRFIAAFGAALPDDQRERLRSAYEDSVLRAAGIGGLQFRDRLADARELEDLSEEQREELADLAGAHAVQLRSLVQELIRRSDRLTEARFDGTVTAKRREMEQHIAEHVADVKEFDSRFIGLLEAILQPPDAQSQ